MQATLYQVGVVLRVLNGGLPNPRCDCLEATMSHVMSRSRNFGELRSNLWFDLEEKNLIVHFPGTTFSEAALPLCRSFTSLAEPALGAAGPPI